MASNLTRFDPFTDIARFDPFRNLDEFFGDFPMMPARRSMGAVPRISDVTDDIKVAIDGNQVSVSAQAKEEKEVSDTGMPCKELHDGQQYRSFTLPQEVDDTKAQAKYENGVLQLTLPKKAGTGRKQLAIQ